MALPVFSYLSPKTLQEALEMRTRHGDKSRVMAGGTDLLIKMGMQALKPEFVIGLNNVEGISYIRRNANNEMAIGPMVKLSDIADHPEMENHFPALAHSAGLTATVQIRNMSTLIGNIVNGSPSADNATPLMIYDARIVIIRANGERTIPLDEFHKGPGQSVMEPTEMIKEMLLPIPGKFSGSSYQKISTRSKVDIAGVCVSTLLTLNDNGIIARARIAMGAVAPKPVRVYAAEKLLEGKKPTTELFKQAAAIAKDESKPITDVRTSAEYRKAMVPVLTLRGLEVSLESATKKMK